MKRSAAEAAGESGGYLAGGVFESSAKRERPAEVKVS